MSTLQKQPLDFEATVSALSKRLEAVEANMGVASHAHKQTGMASTQQQDSDAPAASEPSSSVSDAPQADAVSQDQSTATTAQDKPTTGHASGGCGPVPASGPPSTEPTASEPLQGSQDAPTSDSQPVEALTSAENGDANNPVSDLSDLLASSPTDLTVALRTLAARVGALERLQGASNSLSRGAAGSGSEGAQAGAGANASAGPEGVVSGDGLLDEVQALATQISDLQVSVHT